jgi:hypothetical protein
LALAYHERLAHAIDGLPVLLAGDVTEELLGDREFSTRQRDFRAQHLRVKDHEPLAHRRR